MGGEADDIEALTAAVDGRLSAGVDVVKVMVTGGLLTPGGGCTRSQYSLDELTAVVRHAHAHNLSARDACVWWHQSLTARLNGRDGSPALDRRTSRNAASLRWSRNGVPTSRFRHSARHTKGTPCQTPEPPIGERDPRRYGSGPLRGSSARALASAGF